MAEGYPSRSQPQTTLREIRAVWDVRPSADAGAGVSPPAVYLHFADRDELIFAVCQDVFNQLDRALEEAAEAFGPLMSNVAVMTADPRVRAEIDPYELALDCWAYVHGLTSLLITKPDFGWPDADAMLDGISTASWPASCSAEPRKKRPPNRPVAFGRGLRWRRDGGTDPDPCHGGSVSAA